MPEQISPLRQRMIDDMTIRNMAVLTQAAYVVPSRTSASILVSHRTS